MKKNSIKICVAFMIIIAILFLCNIIKKDKDKNNTIINNISTYKISNSEAENLATTQIVEKTSDDEQNIETQAVEDEGFQEQGVIAYNGSDKTPNVSLGSYVGLTYYSQIDNRWSSHSYTSTGNSSQTIGSSGCGATAGAMIVTAIKGTITPDTMGDLYVNNGYRSANDGTYWSAFEWTADVFGINFTDTSNLDTAISLLRNNYYVVVSCGQGLFTYGGHYIVLTGIDGNTISIYDPYLYSGKFDTSTRRGKVTTSGNTVYCTVENFRNYANASHFFCFEHSASVKINNVVPVTTSTYIRYVKVNSYLNIRNSVEGSIIGKLYNGAMVDVYETSGDWAKIGDNRWVNSGYLIDSTINANTTNGYSTGTYKVNATILNVRNGAGTNYFSKKYYQLSANARYQNRKNGNYYANGYLKNTVCTVTKVINDWGLTKSGWINLIYCVKI